ncbi:PepSY-like domain-containing protein [Mariniflexile sp. HNIBRBA6329]|uniref:PepSY-like domain-containing protein n=1 Tax=Mariniflexile sp. HNIBRBA6329 TaxID=3373088 RepID=UPI003746EA56
MNRIIVITILLLFAKITFAQNIDQSRVPAVVLNTFQLKFPNADDVKWKKDKNDYKIYFKINNKENKLTLNYKGNVLEHSQDLYISEIPKVVLETIKSRVPYFDIQDADKYEKSNRITYEIKFKIDGKYRFFWINDKGELLKYRQELKDSEIPSTISNLIKNNYGKIDIDYSKYVEERGEIIYIVDGEINDEDHNFRFDDKGNIIKHIHDIKHASIPDSVIKTIASEFKDFDIKDADFIEEKGKSYYYLRMKKSKNQVYVTFDENGKVLKVKS